MTVPSKGPTKFRGTPEILGDLNPTTRCYPRTLRDAFPHDAENAKWFFPHETYTTLSTFAYYALGAVMWICLAYYFAR